jgi:hypothetical protein
MGSFSNIPRLNSARIRRLLRITLSLLVMFAAPLAAADAADADVADVAKDERAVSTSPLPADAGERATPATQQPTQPRPLPLTRAASQQRIDSISPRGWLARYGLVDVAHRH